MILSVWRSKQEISFEWDLIMMGELLYCVRSLGCKRSGRSQEAAVSGGEEEGDWAQLSPAWCLQYVSC